MCGELTACEKWVPLCRWPRSCEHTQLSFFSLSRPLSRHALHTLLTLSLSAFSSRSPHSPPSLLRQGVAAVRAQAALSRVTISPLSGHALYTLLELQLQLSVYQNELPTAFRQSTRIADGTPPAGGRGRASTSSSRSRASRRDLTSVTTTTTRSLPP